MLDYNSLFMLFSFVGGGDSICPGAELDYVPREWVEELHIVHDAHLFFLLIHTSSFGAGQSREMARCFSQCGAA
jgi:hypothetical protein